MLYIKGKHNFKGTNINRKLINNCIYDWKYKND